MACEKCLFRNSPDVCDLLCAELEEAGELLGLPVFLDPTLEAGDLVFGPYYFEGLLHEEAEDPGS